MPIGPITVGHRPHFEWLDCGVPKTLTLNHAQRPWAPVRAGVGGSRRVTSGERQSMMVRIDYMVDLFLLVEEDTEWALFTELWDWAVSYGEPFTFAFNQEDAASVYTVDWESPQGNQESVVQRRPTWLDDFEVQIRLRNTASAPFDYPFETVPFTP